MYVPNDKIMSGWQPIETAPKDGTDVLLWNGLERVVGAWGNITSRRAAAWADTWGRIVPQPTHWQSLPAPPAEGKESK